VYRETARFTELTLKQTLKDIANQIVPSFGNFRGKFCRVPASYSLTLGWIPILREVDKGAVDAVKFASRIHYVNHWSLKSGYLGAVLGLPRLDITILSGETTVNSPKCWLTTDPKIDLRSFFCANNIERTIASNQWSIGRRHSLSICLSSSLPIRMQITICAERIILKSIHIFMQIHTFI